ncbi:MAG: adenine deaminase, partial [Deltaproteobacteria bacterium]
MVTPQGREIRSFALSPRDALERLRSGYWMMLREGSFRRDLERTLKPVIARRLNTQRLILVTDGMAPDDVAADGHMDFVVRRAIELGSSPMQAIQAATLNPATYSGLEQEVGGVAPGRYADIAFLENLDDVRVDSTMIGGRVVAKQGKSLVSPRPITWPEETLRCLRLSANVSPASFHIPCSSPRARIRVMELLSQNITTETIMD